jgi:hypothetical protein
MECCESVKECYQSVIRVSNIGEQKSKGQREGKRQAKKHVQAIGIWVL